MTTDHLERGHAYDADEYGYCLTCGRVSVVHAEQAEAAADLARQVAGTCAMRLPRAWDARRPIDHLHSMVATLADPGEERTPLQVIWDARWLQDQVDRAMQQLADDARTAGASWADVGAALGISRQAAQQRFGGKR